MNLKKVAGLVAGAAALVVGSEVPSNVSERNRGIVSR
jgi:hypothetical protein